MAARHVIRIYWAPRSERLDSYAGRLHRWLGELGRAHHDLRDWRFVSDDREGRADSPQAVQAALAAGAEEWELGDTPQTAYALRLFVGREMASPAEIHITCGIEPLPLGALFTPNQLTIAIRHDAPGDLQRTEVAHAALASAASLFEADFGHAGSDTVPTPAMALYSPGVPPVGWMTFLSKAYPPIPAKLPAPAVSYPAGNGGHIVVAHPKPFREHDPHQLRAIAELDAALRNAGVLLPWAKRAS